MSSVISELYVPPAPPRGQFVLSASGVMLILSVAFQLFAFGTVSAQPHRVCTTMGFFPASGPVHCWDTAGNLIACPGTGQDGEIRAGKPLRYVDNGDGTLLDLNTRLVWEKLSRDGSIHDVSHRYDWRQALLKVGQLNQANFAGHSDWRLPNVKEL
jgi:hypothetical protein